VIHPTSEPLPESLARAFSELVAGASSVLIGTHLNPDGDALGSALAMSHYLDGLGITNEVVCHHVPPKNMRFLPGITRVRMEPTAAEHDLGIILDLDSIDRLGTTAPFFEACRSTIVIDHHVPHEAPGDLRIILTDASATAAILSKLFLELDAKITAAMATCLLTGIVTDTGSFRFRNTNPDALILAGQLLRCGADINQISEEVFQRKTEASARLLGQVLETMHLEADNQLAWAVIREADFERIGAKDEDTEGFVNELLAIETVQIAALGRETKPGKVRVSLRSRGDLDVAEVGRQFAGGGHKNAAGCTVEGDVEPAMRELVRALERCLESS
jgi:phosphoesterase RecJ-like protein